MLTIYFLLDLPYIYYYDLPYICHSHHNNAKSPLYKNKKQKSYISIQYIVNARTCTRAYARVCVRVCMCVCVRARARVCVCVGGRVHARVTCLFQYPAMPVCILCLCAHSAVLMPWVPTAPCSRDVSSFQAGRLEQTN